VLKYIIFLVLDELLVNLSIILPKR